MIELNSLEELKQVFKEQEEQEKQHQAQFTNFTDLTNFIKQNDYKNITVEKIVGGYLLHLTTSRGLTLTAFTNHPRCDFEKVYQAIKENEKKSRV